MSTKARRVLRDVGYAMSSNFIAMLVSVVGVLALPKVLGPSDFGLLQLYLMYSGYVGLLQFGWNDGVYLRYGGMTYQSLDRSVFFSQFWMLLASQIILGSVVAWVAEIHAAADKRLVWGALAASVVVLGVRVFLLFVLQMTGRIRDYSRVVTIGSLVYVGVSAGVLLSGYRDYALIVGADLLGKLCSLFVAAFICRQLIFQRVSTFRLNFREAFDNCSSGINLTVANVASLLVTVSYTH